VVCILAPPAAPTGWPDKNFRSASLNVKLTAVRVLAPRDLWRLVVCRRRRAALPAVAALRRQTA